MKMKCTKKVLSFILCMMLIVAMALCTVGCSGKTNEEPSTGNVEASQDVADENGATDEVVEQAESVYDEYIPSDLNVLGSGKNAFVFTVVDLDGNEYKYVIRTDKEIVGDALQELNLIQGDEGAYGLYVKFVLGIEADYDKDQTYWAFYVNDEYAMTGVDVTPIEEGKTYSFKKSK